MRSRNGAFFPAIILCISFLLGATPWQATGAAPAVMEELQVPRVDGSVLHVSLQRPATQSKVPLLVYIDGSLCIPSTLNWSVAWLQRAVDSELPFALAVVEKPGPTVPPRNPQGDVEIGPEFKCSEEFRRYYSIDQRVLDHLRVLQHLARHAPWWNGELLIWGFSDGGRIGAQLAAYSPRTRAVALVGFGGGMRMGDSMENMVCEAAHNPVTCRKTQRAQMDEIRIQPVSTRDWMGESNTYKAWASRLDAVEVNVLRDLEAPLLVVQGERDRSVPVASARRLAELMSQEDSGFRYREVAGMGHSLLSNLTEEQSYVLHQEILNWLMAPRSDQR